MFDEDPPAPARSQKLSHVIGERLDDLSIQEFDDRIALLRAEIERLVREKEAKEAAQDVAASIFRS